MRYALQSSPFWILVRALREFVNDPETNQGAQLLPLVGNIPDMKATSSGFASLVSLYRTKAKKDMADYRRHLAAIMSEARIVDDGKVISDEMINVFVKNAAFVEVVKGRKMRDEYERPQTKDIGERRLVLSTWMGLTICIRSCVVVEAIETASQGDPFAVLEEDEEAPTPCGPIHFYLALRAADVFNVEHSRWPGSGTESEDPDGSKDLEECLHCAEKVLRICTGNETATVDASLDMAVKEMYVRTIKRILKILHLLTGFPGFLVLEAGEPTCLKLQR